MVTITQAELRLPILQRQRLISQRQEEAVRQTKLEQELIKKQQEQELIKKQEQEQTELTEGSMYFINKYAQTSSLGVVPERYQTEVNRLLAIPEIKKYVRSTQQKISDPYRYFMPEKVKEIETQFKEIEAQKLTPDLEQAKIKEIQEARTINLSEQQKELDLAKQDYQKGKITGQQYSAETQAIKDYYQYGTTTQSTPIPRRIGRMSFEGEPSYRDIDGKSEIVRTRIFTSEAKVKPTVQELITPPETIFTPYLPTQEEQNLLMQRLAQQKQIDYSIPQRVTIGGEAYTTPQSIPTRATFKDILTMPIALSEEVSRSAGKGITFLATKLGVKGSEMIIPEKTIPQRVTIGGEFKIPEQKIKVLTPESLGKATETGFQLGSYFIPYVGTAILGSSFARGSYTALDKSLTIGERVSGGIEAGTSALFLGLKYVPKVLPKTEFTLSETTYRVKPREPTFKMETGIVTTTTTPEGLSLTKFDYPITGKGRLETFGRKVELTKQVNWLGKEFKPKVVYEGVPYGEIGKKTYKQAEDILLKYSGLNEAQTKQALRFTAPKIIEPKFTGIGSALYGLEKPLVSVIGKQEITPKIINLGEFKTRGFTPERTYVKVQGVELGTRGEITGYLSTPSLEKVYLKGKGEFMKVSQRGKTQELFKQLSGAKFIKEGKLPFPIEKGVYQMRPFELYQEKSISRRLLPSGRLGKESLSTSKIFVSKEEPLLQINIPQEISIKPVKSIPKPRSIGEINADIMKNIKDIAKTGRDIYGKPSEQILDLGKQARTQIASVIPRIEVKAPKFKTVEINIPKPKEIPIPKVSARFDIATTSKYPSQTKDVFGGLGVAETKFKTLEPSKEKILLIPKIKDIAISKSKSEERLKQPIKLDERLIEKTKSQEKLITNLVSPSKEAQKSQQQLKQQEKLIQQQRLVQKVIPRMAVPRIATPRVPEIKTSRIPIIKVPFRKKDISDVSGRQRRIGKGLFTTIVRYKGKFIEVGKSSTLKGAEMLGISKARKELSASVRVRDPLGRLVRLQPTQEFRKSKSVSDPFSIIQHPYKRLSDPLEVKAIIKSRNRRFL